MVTADSYEHLIQLRSQNRWAQKYWDKELTKSERLEFFNDMSGAFFERNGVCSRVADDESMLRNIVFTEFDEAENCLGSMNRKAELLFPLKPKYLPYAIVEFSLLREILSDSVVGNCAKYSPYLPSGEWLRKLVGTSYFCDYLQNRWGLDLTYGCSGADCVLIHNDWATRRIAKGFRDEFATISSTTKFP
jgi:hypothetical protein